MWAEWERTINAVAYTSSYIQVSDFNTNPSTLIDNGIQENIRLCVSRITGVI